jgi:protein PhnA
MSEEEVVKDSNGTILNDGDSVTVIKDLKVKGSKDGLKRGTVIKNISLSPGSSEPIEGSGQWRGFSIKAEYVKKA